MTKEWARGIATQPREPESKSFQTFLDPGACPGPRSGIRPRIDAFRGRLSDGVASEVFLKLTALGPIRPRRLHFSYLSPHFREKDQGLCFFLDFQERIRVRLIRACYFKRRCFGEIGTSAFFQPEAEGLIFLLGRSAGEKTRVRLSRKDLIQLEGKVIKVLVGDQVHVSISPYDPSHGLITYRLK